MSGVSEGLIKRPTGKLAAVRKTLPCRRWSRSKVSIFLPGAVPAKRDVDGHLVDLPLVR